MRGSFSAITALLVGLLGACQSTTPKQASVAIDVEWQPPETCRILVAGQSYILGADNVRLMKALKRAIATSRDAFLKSNDLNVPYKCVGGAIIMAQEAGFKRIGFIADPPPPSR
jgi:biopolymer transport protein ExbD